MVHVLRDILLIMSSLFLLGTINFKAVKAHYDFAIQIDSYDNPDEELFNGTCCDCCRRIPGNERCQNECDTMLQFCLRNANHSHDDFNCTLWGISATDADPKGLNAFILGAWQGEVQLFVRVFDRDDSSEELIDHIFVEIDLTLDDPFTTAVSYTGVYDQAALEMRFQVSCAINNYGTDCSIFCEDTDDETGHYTCNSNGTIVCNTGYINETSYCTECIPSHGCSSINGFCTVPGECICRSGYSGDNCTMIGKGIICPGVCHAPTTRIPTTSAGVGATSIGNTLPDTPTSIGNTLQPVPDIDTSSSGSGNDAGIAIGVVAAVIIVVGTVAAIVLILIYLRRKKVGKKQEGAQQVGGYEVAVQTHDLTKTGTYTKEVKLTTNTVEQYDPLTAFEKPSRSPELPASILAHGAQRRYHARAVYNPGYDIKSIFLTEGQEVEVLGTNQYGWWWVKTTNNQTGIVEEGRVPASYLEAYKDPDK